MAATLGNPRHPGHFAPVFDPTMTIGPEVRTRAAAGDPLALARALVATPSVNPGLDRSGGGESEIARLTGGWLEKWGFDVELQEVAPRRWNVVARRGRGRPLLFNGHLDTVGVEGMTVPPFGGEVRNGRLLGRGACDMKGGVAAILAAAAALSKGEAAGELIVALTADEERESLGMQALVESGMRSEAAVVCEPTSLAVAPAHKGFVWVEVTFRGRAAHGSRPDEGVDAIRHAGIFLGALEVWEAELAARPAHPLLGRGTFHAGTIQGGSAPSVYPARCALTLERRTLPGETGEEVMAEVSEVARAAKKREPALNVEVVRGLARPGTQVSRDAPVVRGLLEACVREGVGGGIEAMTAWVDAAFLNEAGIPAVCFGPGSIAQAHSEDEWAPVEEIESCAKVLETFALGFWEDRW